MSNTKKPFWETNTNPITMFTSSGVESKIFKSNKGLKSKFIKAEDLDNYVTVNSLMERFGIGAKKIKNLLATIGKTPKICRRKVYYKNDDFDLIVDLLTPKKVAVIDSEMYVSNQELIKMFKYSEFKAWDISRKEKLTKKSFGKAVYYEREKAIKAFLKYKKE